MTAKMLAVIVAPPHLTASGGARAGRDLSEALAAAGWDMTVASMAAGMPAKPGRARELAVRTSLPALARLLPRRLRSLFYRSDIPAAVAAGGWNLVHLHNPMPALEMARIAGACRRAQIPYVVSTHGFNEVANGLRVYGFGALRQMAWRMLVQRPVGRTVRRAAAVLALSPADIDGVRAFGFAGPITIVPNGVMPQAASSTEDDRQICARFGVLPPGEAPGLTCMFLGNHTPNKGVPILLDAFAGLAQPYQLIIGGERRPEIDYDGACGRTGPGQSIIVTGRLSDAEVGALLRRTDLFVFPTLADTFPLVVLEAMAQGCAILASNVGGIAHQLQGGAGELLAPGDVGALRAAVARLATQPAAIAAMKAAATARAHAQFTWAAAAAAAAASYREVLDGQWPDDQLVDYARSRRGRVRPRGLVYAPIRR